MSSAKQDHDEALPAIQLVAPDTVSTEAIESAFAWLPNGDLLLARRDGKWGQPRTTPGRLLHFPAHNQGAPAGSSSPHYSFGPPTQLFPHLYDASDPAVSQDGRLLVFASSHPGTEIDSDRDLWLSTKDGDSWSKPQRLGPEINSDTEEMGPSFGPDRRLWFSSMRPGGLGAGDLWHADWAGETFDEATPVGLPVNSEFGEWNVMAARDGSFLIFESSSRPTNLSVPGDLYLSRRLGGESWGEPIHLGWLNTTGSDLGAGLNPQGDLLYFVSTGREGPGEADLFRVPLTAVLEWANRRSPTLSP